MNRPTGFNRSDLIREWIILAFGRTIPRSARRNPNPPLCKQRAGSKCETGRRIRSVFFVFISLPRSAINRQGRCPDSQSDDHNRNPEKAVYKHPYEIDQVPE